MVRSTSGSKMFFLFKKEKERSSKVKYWSDEDKSPKSNFFENVWRLSGWKQIQCDQKKNRQMSIKVAQKWFH